LKLTTAEKVCALKCIPISKIESYSIDGIWKKLEDYLNNSEYFFAFMDSKGGSDNNGSR
jgi:hypothetical protein